MATKQEHASSTALRCPGRDRDGWTFLSHHDGGVSVAGARRLRWRRLRRPHTQSRNRLEHDGHPAAGPDDVVHHPTVCLRCAQALDAIDFAPYAATNS